MKPLIRKIMVVLIVLITLSGCSQNAVPEAPESLPAATEAPTTMPPPTLVPTPLALPDYYPPTDFEVAGVWRAKSFGDQGAALLYMSDIVDGTVSFKLYMYQYVCGQNVIDRWMNLSTIMATASYDGDKYLFSADQESSGSVGVDGLIKLDGALSLSEETLVLKYSDAELPDTYQGTAEFGFGVAAPSIRYENEEGAYGNFTTFLPVTFTRVPEGDAGTVMYEMPMYEDEIVLPFTNVPTPDELKSIMGTPVESVKEDEWVPSVSVSNTYESAYLWMTEFNDQTGNLHYHVWNFVSSDPDVIPEVRCVNIGDNISKVLSSFRCGQENYANILSSTREDGEIVLYGPTSIMSQFCKVIFKDGNLSEVKYIDEIFAIIYNFDNNGHVTSIEYADDGYS